MMFFLLIFLNIGIIKLFGVLIVILMLMYFFKIKFLLFLDSEELNVGNLVSVFVVVFIINISGVILIFSFFFLVSVFCFLWNVLRFVIFVLLNCVICGICI